MESHGGDGVGGNADAICLDCGSGRGQKESATMELTEVQKESVSFFSFSVFLHQFLNFLLGVFTLCFFFYFLLSVFNLQTFSKCMIFLSS